MFVLFLQFLANNVHIVSFFKQMHLKSGGEFWGSRVKGEEFHVKLEQNLFIKNLMTLFLKASSPHLLFCFFTQNCAHIYKKTFMVLSNKVYK